MAAARERPRELAVSAAQIQHRLVAAESVDQALHSWLQSLARLGEVVTVLGIEETVDFEEALGHSRVHAVIIMGAILTSRWIQDCHRHENREAASLG